MVASAIAPAVSARLGDGRCSVASDIGPGHSRESHRRGYYYKPRTRRPLDGQQWEPGQLNNSVDHANTLPECCAADLTHSPRLNAEKNEF
jgi:hypothetical protein